MHMRKATMSRYPGQRGLDVMDAFGPVLKKTRAAGEQSGADGRGDDAAKAGPSSEATREPDSHMSDADEPGSPRGGWDEEAVDVAAMHVSDGAMPLTRLSPPRLPPTATTPACFRCLHQLLQGSAQRHCSHTVWRHRQAVRSCILLNSRASLLRLARCDCVCHSTHTYLTLTIT